MKKILLLYCATLFIGCVRTVTPEQLAQQQRDSIALVQQHIADSIVLDQKNAFVHIFRSQYPIESVVYDPTVFTVDNKDTAMMNMYALMVKNLTPEDIDFCHEFPSGDILKRDLNVLLDIALALTMSMTQGATPGPYQVSNSSALFNFDASNKDAAKLLRTMDRNLTLEEKVWLERLQANELLTDGSSKSLENKAIQIIVSQLALRKYLREKK